MKSGALEPKAAVVWLVGIGHLVTRLEFAPRLGGAELCVHVVYLALHGKAG